MVDEPSDDLAVPETNYTFGQLIRAQALGDFEPRTPLAKKLWERRQAVIKEALARGEPLLQSWEEVEQEVRERRGERDIGEDR